MTDVFLYPEETSRGDIRLRDPSSAGGGTSYQVAVNEAAITSDAVVTAATLLAALNEIGTGSDNFGTLALFPTALTETAAIIDAPSAAASMPAGLAEITNTVETVGSDAAFVGVLSEAGAGLDSILALANSNATGVENAFATDIVASSAAVAPALNETVAAIDDVAVVADFVIAIAESVNSIDVSSTASAYTVLLLESGTAGDAVLAGQSYLAIIGEIAQLASDLAGLVILPPRGLAKQTVVISPPTIARQVLLRNRSCDVIFHVGRTIPVDAELTLWYKKPHSNDWVACRGFLYVGRSRFQDWEPRSYVVGQLTEDQLSRAGLWSIYIAAGAVSSDIGIFKVV